MLKHTRSLWVPLLLVVAVACTSTDEHRSTPPSAEGGSRTPWSPDPLGADGDVVFNRGTPNSGRVAFSGDAAHWAAASADGSTGPEPIERLEVERWQM
jgi:hypothetical protein